MAVRQSIDYVTVAVVILFLMWHGLEYVMDVVFFFNKQEKLPSVEEKLQAFKGAEEFGFQAMVNSICRYRKSCLGFSAIPLIQILFFNSVLQYYFQPFNSLF